MDPAPTSISPVRAFVGIAAACALGAVAVIALHRPGAPTWWTAAAMFAQAQTALLLALSHRWPKARAMVGLRVAGLIAIGLLTALPGYYFGPNSGFAAPIVMMLTLAGILAGGIGAPPRTGWAIYGALALGQATVLALISTHIIPDVSMTPVILGSRPMWTHVAGHLFVQAMYLAAYLSGRAFQRRYGALVAQVDEASRAEAVRTALLEEARADYRRALVVGKHALGDRVTPAAGTGTVAIKPQAQAAPSRAGAESPDTEVGPPTPAALRAWASGENAPVRASDPGLTPMPVPRDPRQSEEKAVGGSDVWIEASRYRMRRVFVQVLISCAGGAALLAGIAVHRGPLYVAWACIAGIALSTWIHNRLSRGQTDPTGYWPWIVAGVLSAGPAYSTGLHSGFAAIVAALLFVGGFFRAPHRVARSDKRHRVWIAIALSHATVFVLVFLRVLPDHGNVPILVAGLPGWEVVVEHVLLQGVYAASFFAGVVVDRRHEALMAEALAAAQRAARQQAMLAAANAAIDRLLGPDGKDIFVGQQVGRYRLERVRGRGGMGDVYEAADLESGELIAVKVIRRDKAADPTALHLFATEARALARVDSAHVARVLEAGGLDADLPYIAMELVEGATLASMLKERGRLPLPEIRLLVRDICAGLRDVHQAGIVHRDLKPQNVIRTGDGAGARWKLLDFGVAQIHDLVGATDGIIAGTPQYMAPEQALGEHVDLRADLYSLCLVVYRALTGRPAYAGGDRVEIAETARGRGPPDPSWYVTVPRDVELVLRIGLAGRAAERFTSAAALASAFDAAFDAKLGREHRDRAELMLHREPWTEVVQPPSLVEHLTATHTARREA